MTLFIELGADSTTRQPILMSAFMGGKKSLIFLFECKQQTFQKTRKIHA